MYNIICTGNLNGTLGKPKSTSQNTVSQDAMKKKAFSHDEVQMLEALRSLPDDKIDTADIPEASPENWRLARRGDLYRPLKQAVTIRLDADIVAWFKDHTAQGGYQTEINRVLRTHVAGARRKS